MPPPLIATAAAGGGGGGGSGGGGGASTSSSHHHQQQQQQQQQVEGGVLASGDWSSVFSPLHQLRRLTLVSDYSFLGSCGALRGLPLLTELKLQGGAKYITTNAAAGGAAGGGGGGGLLPLPPSWLLQPGGDWPALVSLQVRRVSPR